MNSHWTRNVDGVWNHDRILGITEYCQFDVFFVSTQKIQRVHLDVAASEYRGSIWLVMIVKMADASVVLLSTLGSDESLILHMLVCDSTKPQEMPVSFCDNSPMLKSTVVAQRSSAAFGGTMNGPDSHLAAVRDYAEMAATGNPDSKTEAF